MWALIRKNRHNLRPLTISDANYLQVLNMHKFTTKIPDINQFLGYTIDKGKCGIFKEINFYIFAISRSKEAQKYIGLLYKMQHNPLYIAKKRSYINS